MTADACPARRGQTVQRHRGLWIVSMKPIRSHNVEFNPTGLILRDAMLRMAPQDEVD
jgi:hypothetical protein